MGESVKSVVPRVGGPSSVQLESGASTSSRGSEWALVGAEGQHRAALSKTRKGLLLSRANKKDYSRKLPTWFNFNLFKRLHGKRYKSFEENELHKRIYLQTALKVLEQRALFRIGQVGSLATLNELSDLVSSVCFSFLLVFNASPEVPPKMYL